MGQCSERVDGVRCGLAPNHGGLCRPGQRQCRAIQGNLRCQEELPDATTHIGDHWARGGDGLYVKWPQSPVLPDVPVPASERQVGGNHYRKFKIQVWDVIDEYELTFYAGGVLKYLLRAGHKGAVVEDLKKARHYLDRLIEIEEAKE